MADNEKDAANIMANSHSGGRGAVKNWLSTVWQTRQLTGGSGNSGNSGGSRSSGKPSGSGAFTGEEIDNYNRYLKTHYKLQNKLEGKRHVRGAETDANREVLKNASKDAKMIRKNTNEDRRQSRDQENIAHAAKYGQVASFDSANGNKRNTIRFAATPARQTNAGKGTGAQGTSKQQTSGKGAAAGRVVGAALGGAVTKNPRGVTAGGAAGAKLGDVIESKVINRAPRGKKA